METVGEGNASSDFPLRASVPGRVVGRCDLHGGHLVL